MLRASILKLDGWGEMSVTPNLQIEGVQEFTLARLERLAGRTNAQMRAHCHESFACVDAAKPGMHVYVGITFGGVRRCSCGGKEAKI